MVGRLRSLKRSYSVNNGGSLKDRGTTKVINKVFNYSFSQSRHLVINMSDTLLCDRITIMAVTQFSPGQSSG